MHREVTYAGGAIGAFEGPLQMRFRASDIFLFSNDVTVSICGTFKIKTSQNRTMESNLKSDMNCKLNNRATFTMFLNKT